VAEHNANVLEVLTFSNPGELQDQVCVFTMIDGLMVRVAEGTRKSPILGDTRKQYGFKLIRRGG
jgi:hypothetical protein